MITTSLLRAGLAVQSLQYCQVLDMKRLRPMTLDLLSVASVERDSVKQIASSFSFCQGWLRDAWPNKLTQLVFS